LKLETGSPKGLPALKISKLGFVCIFSFQIKDEREREDKDGETYTN
jgi:hypothetical protein